MTANHQHQHEVDAIAMNSFRCRMAGATWLCLDAELVHLDFESRSTRFEDSKAEVEQVGKDWIFKRGLLHLSKPARYPAVERIVVPALEMRPRRELGETAFGEAQNGISPTPIASTIRHIGVKLKPIPTRCKS